ncbi:hypothetical protein RR48_04592 [Papilio machaon]|uniref:Peptidase S1 domain-containing protein n=1 Tax=Papilio machaon TaxID=76193 RepID=A0A0N1IEG8_PAPMA|nr:hypothetical protein RR48_04592 [Papilio machaon]
MYKQCVREDKRVGYCVEDNMCFANLTIATGTTFIGDTEASFARAITPAPGPGVTPMPEFKKSNCSLSYGDCPWCVGLYRVGGDVAQGHRMESGLYCAGALVAPSVVLTSGTCVRAVSGEHVWARVPQAADPAHHYAVTKNVIHPNYNSGQS